MMASNWPSVKLGDLFELKHGFAFKGEHFSDKGEFVLLTPGNFNEEGGLKLKGEKEKFYSGQFSDEYLLHQGDIVVAMTDLIQNAPILGSSALIPRSGRFLHNQRLGKIVNLKADRALPEFVFYLFNLPSVRSQIKGSATGATVKHTAPSRIYDVSALLPPLPVQRRIAGILSDYDELIENSQRRIKILESMARALYREWFVHFRFPGHENHPRIASPLGEIPLGWEVKKLGDVVRFGSGKAIKPGGEGLYPVYGSNGIIGGSDEFLHENGVVIGRVGAYCGAVVYCRSKFWASDNTLVAYPVSKDVNAEFLYSLLADAELSRYAGGAAQPLVTQTVLKQIEVLIPPAALLETFGEVAGAFERQTATLKRQIKNLHRTRDLLLPRLLSGQIKVETA